MDQERETQDLELRIRKLEDALGQARARRQSIDVSPEDIQAYRKVRDALAFDPETVCGINECMPCIIRPCVVNPCVINPCIIRRCDVECICGPCGFGGFGGFGGGGRFGGLGG